MNHSEIRSIDSTAAGQLPLNVVVRGRTKSTRALLGRFLASLFIAACIISSAVPDPINYRSYTSSTWGLLLFLGVTLVIVGYGLWKEWRYPPFVEIKDGQLTAQQAGRTARTSTTNVADVFMSGGQLSIRYYDLQSVDTSRRTVIQQGMAREFRISGCHFVMPYGVFELGQSNALRHALGRPYQEWDERKARLFDFVIGLRQVTPRAWVTGTIIVINVVFFVLLGLAGTMKPGSSANFSTSISPEVVLDWGGNFAPLTANGQPWRLLTCMFIHWTVIHLFFNLWVLNDIGRLVERVLGSLPYVLVYLFSGLCGSLATIYWSLFSQPSISAGASGAVFGLFGVMLGILMRRHRDFPIELLREHRASCLGFLGFNLLFAMMMPNIDLAAHLGGLAGGFLCGLFARPILPPRSIPSLSRRLALLTPLCVSLTIAGVLLLPRPTVAVSWELNKFLATEREVIDKYNKIITTADSGRTSADIADAIQRDVVSPWRMERERMSALTNLQPRDVAAWRAILRYAQLREEGFDLTSQAMAEQSAVKHRQAVAKSKEAQKILEDWVPTEGERYGLSIEPRVKAKDARTGKEN